MRSYYEIIHKEVTEELNNGNMPPAFQDAYQLATPNDPQIKNIQTELERILTRILEKNADKITIPNFKPRIYISLENEVNAFTAPLIDKHPFIVITLDLIKNAKSEDEIAGVISHEIHHNLFKDKKKEFAHGHSQLEECACDKWAAEALRDAGYQITGYADFFARGETTKDPFAVIESTHPSNQTRFQQINNTEIVLNKTLGKTSLTETKLPLTPKSSLLKTPNIKFTTQLQLILTAKGIDKQTKAERLSTIVDALKNGDFGSGRSTIYNREKIAKELIATIEKGSGSKNDTENSVLFSKLQELRNWLFETRYETKVLLGWVGQEIRANSLAEQDHIQQLDNSFAWLIAHRNNENGYEAKAAEYSHRIIQILRDHFPSNTSIEMLKYHFDSYHSFFSTSPSKMDFAMPSQTEIDGLKEGEHLTTSWDSLMRYAQKEFTEQGTTYAASTLHILGINHDPRLKPMTEKLHFSPVLLTKNAEKSQKFLLDDQGRIINFNAVNRQLQEEKLLSNINWNELQSPPTGMGFTEFTKKYHAWLKLDPNAQRHPKYETSYVFLEELLKRIYALPATQIEMIAQTDAFQKFLNTIRPPIDTPNHSISINNPVMRFFLEPSAAKFFRNEASWKLFRDSYLLSVAKGFDQLDLHTLFLIPKFNSLREWQQYIATINYDQQDKLFLNALAEISAKLLPTFSLTSFNDLVDFQKLCLFEQGNSNLKYALNYLKTQYLQSTLNTFSISKSILENAVDLFQLLNTRIITDNEYKNVNSYLIDKADSQVKLIDKIYRCYSAMKDDLHPSQKLNLLEKLILNGLNDPNTNSANPTIRVYRSDAFLDPNQKHYFISQYITELANQCLQFQDDPTTYDAKIRTLVDRVLSGTSYEYSKMILVGLADRVVAQRELSEHIKLELEKKSISILTGNYSLAENSYKGINAICSDANSRKQFSEFLLGLPTSENCKNLGSNITYGLLGDKNGDYEIQLQLVHKNFWSSDPLARAAIFQKLLYSRGVFEPPITPNNLGLAVQEYVCAKVLPNVYTRGKPIDTPERKVVTAYLEASTEAERTAVLSMMLATQEPTYSNEKQTHGKVLNIVLENLGPAGTKLAQAINSHPETPEDIKRDTASSKSMADKPNRWELFQLLDECYGDKAKNIKYVDDVLGAGAYGVTVKVQKYNNDESAITLLRAHAFERAKTEFNTLQTSATILARKDKSFFPVIEMVGQANRASDEETNMELAAKQNKIAEKLYDDITVTIGPESKQSTYTFFTADWIGYGERYKETAVVPGKHFVDIPFTTDEEKAEKRNLAIAILTIELRNLVAGKEFDHDRHGAQQRIFGNYIGQFDFGGVSLHPPSKDEKEIIGRILGMVLRQVDQKANFVDALHKALGSVSKNSANKDFLARVERAILALNEYIPFINKGDMTSIIASVRMHMDDVVARNLGRELVNSNIPFANRVFTQKALTTLDLYLIERIETPITLAQTKTSVKTSQGYYSHFKPASVAEVKESKSEVKPSNRLG